MKVAMAEAGERPDAAAAAASARRREPEIYTVPAEREITIRDLMTHTAGLGERRLSGARGANASRRARATITWRITSRTLGDVPLDFQPGIAVALQRARRHRHARPHRRDRSRA